MKHNPVKSISFRLTILSWAMIVVTLAVFTLAMLPLQRMMVRERMTTEARDIITSISQVTASALITEDYSFIVEHCMRLVKESKSILYIAVVRKNGFALVHTADGWKKEPLKREWTNVAEQDTSSGAIVPSKLVGDDVFRLVVPFRYSGIEWGMIHVGLSLKKYEEDMSRIYTRTLLMGILCILFGLFVSFGYSRRFSRPIRELEISAGRIATGDLTHRVRISSGDEIGRLAESFNHMTAEWQRSHTDLLLSQRLTSNIVRSLNDMLIVSNDDGTIRMVNSATQERLGYAEHELLGRHISIIFQNDHADESQPVISVEGQTRTERTFRTRSGASIPVLFSATSLKDNDQATDGIVCVAVDITERKEYELELQRGQERLEKRVEERTAELATTNQSLQFEIREHLMAQEQLESSLCEKEVLLKEIHHRVKNNLQVITSLLNMQASTIEDPRALEAFAESKHRVKSMAMIHEKLYQAKDLAHIDFSEYIRNLAASLLQSYGTLGERVRMSVQSDPIFLDVDAAIPCGLIINELVTNALKYAFPDPRTGTIALRISGEDGNMVLAVSDDGVGLPKGFDIEAAQTLGLRLVKILANQLRATLEITNGVGTNFRFSIPKRAK
jgi:PAS domain S-box-containing protein